MVLNGISLLREGILRSGDCGNGSNRHCILCWSAGQVSFGGLPHGCKNRYKTHSVFFNLYATGAFREYRKLINSANVRIFANMTPMRCCRSRPLLSFKQDWLETPLEPREVKAKCCSLIRISQLPPMGANMTFAPCFLTIRFKLILGVALGGESK